MASEAKAGLRQELKRKENTLGARLEARDDEEAASDGGGVFENGDYKVGALESLYEARANPVASEGSGYAAYGTE